MRKEHGKESLQVTIFRVNANEMRCMARRNSGEECKHPDISFCLSTVSVRGRIFCVLVSGFYADFVFPTWRIPLFYQYHVCEIKKVEAEQIKMGGTSNILLISRETNKKGEGKTSNILRVSREETEKKEPL